MKILHTVESYLPVVNGMSEVVKQISEYLVKQGHEVTVATSFCDERAEEIINGVAIKSFRITGKMVDGINGETQLYKDYILESDYDLITNFAAQQWATDLCLDLLSKIKAKKVFVPTGFSELNNDKYKEYFSRMRSWLKDYDMNVFLSNNYQDINFARLNSIENIQVIPNGAEYEEFSRMVNFDIRKRLNINEETRLILHVGSYTGVKGHFEAIDIFLSSQIIDKTCLLLVGQNFNEHSSLPLQLNFNWFGGFFKKKFYRLGTIKLFFRYLKLLLNVKKKYIFLIPLKREQLVAAYQQSDVVLFPSMIECSPVVLFEAMASGTPFLVTNVGNAAEIISECDSGLLLPTKIDKNGLSHAVIKDSASILEKVINDKALLAKLGKNGYQKWIENYTWENISARYEELYFRLLQE